MQGRLAFYYKTNEALYYMKLPCENNCPFPSGMQPCEPPPRQWNVWRQTPEGLRKASFVGECLSDRINRGEVRDALTGMDNFELMRIKLASRFNHPTRSSEQVRIGSRIISPVLAVFIDGDHFGNYNKDYDQDTGDVAIQELAAKVRSSKRESDFIGRRGGDEFVVVMFGLQRHIAFEKMNRLRQTFRTGGDIDLAPESGRLSWTASVAGAYMEHAQGMDDVDEVLRAASSVLGNWKNTDRGSEPPLMINVPSAT